MPWWREPSYSEAKSEMKNRKPLSSIQLQEFFGECPKPDGVFKNETVASDGRNTDRLERYFWVEGFEIPATSYRGGREDDDPLPASASPINLLGSEKRMAFDRFINNARPKKPSLWNCVPRPPDVSASASEATRLDARLRAIKDGSVVKLMEEYVVKTA
jgi:hypothetical protein